MVIENDFLKSKTLLIKFMNNSMFNPQKGRHAYVKLVTGIEKLTDFKMKLID